MFTSEFSVEDIGCVGPVIESLLESDKLSPFVSGPAKRWDPKCRVIVRPGDFPDNDKTSDHRPVELRLELK